MRLTARVVDVAEHGRRLSLEQGFLVVHDERRAELGRVPLDDVGAVLLHAQGTSCTTPLIAALAHRGAVLAVCDGHHLPVAWTLPVGDHSGQARTIAAQVDAPKPFTKRLWQYVVQAKIASQADVLAVCGKNRALLDGLVGLVRSGDPANVEARAAQAYWPTLFGAAFRRDREAPGINAALNYGYTVLRASVARAVVACGLHPSIGVKHRRDPLALVSDLMEPFRAVVDCRVAIMAVDGRADTSRRSREELVELLGGDIEAGVMRFARSIGDAYLTGVCPVWRRSDVAVGAVRSAGDDTRGSLVSVAVPERPSGPRLREASAVGVHAEVPWGGDDAGG